jgi:maleylacetate reductase
VGEPWEAALMAEADRLKARRVFVVASTSLRQAMPLRERLEQTLGERLSGLIDGVRPHTPLDDVVSVAAKAKSAGADLLVAIGGGSVIDAVKVAQLALFTDAFDPTVFGRFKIGAPPIAQPVLNVRVVAIPTTLSGAEFTSIAGISDLQRNVKELYAQPQMAPVAVLLDPRITLETPPELWLSTGVRAVDHAVEDVCAVNSQPLADAASLHALRLLGPSLRLTRRVPAALEPRLDSMVGVWLSLIGMQLGVEKGLSHAIGHILGGSAGVPHGVTSCVVLAHVLAWNAEINADRQRLVSAALGAPEVDAAELVATLVAELGLPSRLRDVGVGREQLDALAELTMADPWTATNPRSVQGPSDVRQILEKSW